MEFSYRCTVFAFTLASVLQPASLTNTTAYCTASTALPDPTAPPLPQMPPSFQTRLEANLVDRGMTMEAMEYADSKGNRAALTVIAAGHVTSSVYDYTEGQIYVIQDGVCKTKTMSNDSLDDYLYGDIRVNGSGHVYSTNDIIKMAKRFGETYMGQKYVRGVFTDHWQSCGYWAVYKANFTLDYYFTALNWTTSMDYPQVPVRADVNGIMQTSSGSRNFHHIYDYYDFRPGIEDPDKAFETPSDVVCPHRKTLELVPKVADQFYYRTEQTSRNKTTNSEVWYDKRYNVMRGDFDETGQAYTAINDFNRGIKYTINKETGVCSVGPIQPESLGSERVGPGSQWLLQLLPPTDFLRLNESFVYVGQRLIRGQTCDLFVAKVGQMAPFFLIQGTATVEAYFSRSVEDPDVTDPGNTRGYSHVLVQMVIHLDASQDYIHLSYFDFDFTHPNPESTFDLTPCFSDTEQIGFSLQIPVKSPADYMPYSQQVQKEVLKHMSVELQLEPTRIQELQVRAGEYYIYVLGRILQRPPLLARYNRIENKSIELIDNMYPNVSTAEECAAKCDDNTDCYSFSLCVLSNTCFISHVVQQADSKDTLLTSDTCTRYTRVVKRPVGLPDHELRSVWIAFRNMVYTGGLVLQLQAPGLSKQITAREVTESDIWRHGSSAFTNHIVIYNKQASITHPSRVLVGLAFDDCAKECVGESKCQGFSICLQTPFCKILDSPLSSQGVTQSHGCYTYRKRTDHTSPPQSSTVTPAQPVSGSVPATPPSQAGTSTTGSASTIPSTKKFVIYKKDAVFNSLAGTKIASSVDVCLQFCIDDPKCDTITICEREEKCHLSYTLPQQHGELVDQQLGCIIYTLSGGDLPSTSKGTSASRAWSPVTGVTSSVTPASGTVQPSLECPTSSSKHGTPITGYYFLAECSLPGIARVTKQLVASSSKCASYCDASTGYECKAFQYCPGTKMCNLLDTRTLPVPRVLRYTTYCEFYSKQFLSDFKKVQPAKTGSRNYIPVSSLDLADCADMCGQDGSCLNFRYCPKNRNCLIATTKQTPPLNAQFMQGCNSYKRNFTLANIQSSDHGSKKNVGVIAGTATGTLLLGLLLGALMVYGIQRHRQRKSFDLDMQCMVTK